MNHADWIVIAAPLTWALTQIVRVIGTLPPCQSEKVTTNVQTSAVCAAGRIGACSGDPEVEGGPIV